jgi:hypothetical protein
VRFIWSAVLLSVPAGTSPPVARLIPAPGDKGKKCHERRFLTRQTDNDPPARDYGGKNVLPHGGWPVPA